VIFLSLAYINENIELVNVQAVSIAYEIIGETAYTALGKLRADRITSKKVWTLESVLLTNQEYTAILNHLESINFGVTLFWLDEFGGVPELDSIDTIITIDSDERIMFFRDGFHNDGRNLSLLVREV